MSEVQQKLLNDKRVVAEIHRHLWLESEKAGYDIGFEKAKEDWLKNFSKAWMKYHMPQVAGDRKAAPEPAMDEKKPAEKKPAPKAPRAKAAKPDKTKRRRAKSYIKK